MNVLKSLEPEERERYNYLKKVFEEEFEEISFSFRINDILVSELLSLLSLCSFFFDEYGSRT
jgi:hypothetical protein